MWSAESIEIPYDGSMRQNVYKRSRTYTTRVQRVQSIYNGTRTSLEATGPSVHDVQTTCGSYPTISPPGGWSVSERISAPGGAGAWRPAAPAGQPPGEERVGYDLQVVCTSCTLAPVASREVLVPLYIDCTRCTRFVYAPERLYTFCDG